MGSSLMSMFSRMSLSAPLAQYSVISVMLCSSADISTHAPMKLFTLKIFLMYGKYFSGRLLPVDVVVAQLPHQLHLLHHLAADVFLPLKLKLLYSDNTSVVFCCLTKSAEAPGLA